MSVLLLEMLHCLLTDVDLAVLGLSFFLTRVTEIFRMDLEIEKPPSPLELIGNKWRDVSTDLARYELSLMQLGKTPMSYVDL